MKSALLALAVLAQPAPDADAIAQADRLVAIVATAYESHADEASAVMRENALAVFEHEFAALNGLDPSESAAFRAGIEDQVEPRIQARRDRMAEMADTIDFEQLVATAPGGVWLAMELARLSGDGPNRDRLLDVVQAVADTGGYQSGYYADFVASYTADATAETSPAMPAHALAPDEMADLAARYQARRDQWAPLVGEIGAMRGREQYVRWLLIEIMARDLAPDIRQVYQSRVGTVVTPIDTANTRRVLEIFDTVDFDAFNAASPATAAEAVGILHHSGDIAVMRRTLALIEPSALAGRFDGGTYARLFDRVAEFEDRPQRYGTQDACIDGRRGIHAIEDPGRVDQRRAEMGLQPLADYRAQLIEMYGEDC